ncbi:MAG: PaaI family thioesterase [Solirubrobacterales bacterium]|nr:PaaI family thioesterase [Solirubrobacterales bacterium]
MTRRDTRGLTPALHHTDGPPRERTITWHDPTAAVDLGRRLSGRDYLAAIKNGQLPEPPIVRLAGIEALHIQPGDTLYRCIADQSFLNPIGLVHGGLACTLLDYAAASALLATLPAEASFTTIELKVSFLRPVRAGDTLLAHGWITKPGQRIAFAEADLRSGRGKLVATASSSLLVTTTLATPQSNASEGNTAPRASERET